MNNRRMHPGWYVALGLLVQMCLPVALAAEAGNEPAEPAAMSPKATIAVISDADFVPDRTQSQSQGSSGQVGLPVPLAQRIIEHLTNSRRFIPVEREALRRVVLEQRFGQDLQQSFLDKTLDRAIEVMGSPDNSYVKVEPDEKSPAGRVPEGGGGVGTTGALADYNDILKDFQDLGTTLGADYVVVGTLARLNQGSSTQAVPYSKAGHTLTEEVIDARLRLRVIDMRSGTVAGAASLQTQVTTAVFDGMTQETDLYDYFDDLGRDIAAKILDITFPARIVSLDPLVISRGSNEGAVAGDVYLVEREGKEIRDANGLEIARLKETLGSVEVVEPQETISVVKAVSGAGFAANDLVTLDLQASESRKQPAVARSGGTLPGEQDGQNAAAGKRATIAVGLVRVNPTARTNGLADGHVKRITDDLILKLGKTNRFVVLERQVDQVFDEKTFDAMMQGEDIRSRLQELAGADYLIHGEITNFYTQRREEKIPYVSEVKVTVTGTGEGMLRIVDTHSGAIIAADKIRVTTALQDNADMTLAMSDFIDRFTTDSVGLVLERLYPVKVLAVTNDGSVYINRGSDAGLQAGMVFDVMRPGMELLDPDTGLSFGRAESKVATVEVTGVEQARATTRVVAGTVPQSGDILHATVVVKEKPQVKVNKPAW